MSMDLQQLRACLLEQPQTGAVVIEDGADNLTLTPAAVLFPIVVRDAGHTVMLTQRTAHLRDHAGQISFPGGRVEADDLSPTHTALRETEEEVGLSRERVEILGFLPEYRTGTGFRVTPVVGLVHPPFDLQPDPFEVAEVFEVPLAFLLDPANHQRHEMHYRGALRQYFAMPYGDYFIWGATAGMIRSLSQRLGLHGA
ncbi:CoA pyrophosphatase [Dechloromonas sp.]|uniref:CoA pyrophosphatase n=1 Tax=Dechloromonas sp. TaxID=1917218 RepID=UPI0011F79A6F|nr:CoA pyrophosphatase [Dechloromonas sp.]MBU3697432.1 CoA pyrophosphatase [Dechloromonas sp.]TEX47119.1 MAG: CoA pyrophosphatase [Rhodocyclaceae bacterium]